MTGDGSSGTIGEALRRATAALMGHSGSPRLDAQLILARVLDCPREYLIAHPEAALTSLNEQIFDKLLKLRIEGMPVAYILGQRMFYDRTFMVTPHVLIPRPETEHLVEAALEWVRGHFGPEGDGARIVDVGTGSGAIAVILAAHLPHARVIATDISAAALLVARVNGRDLTNLHFLQADLLAALRGPLDVICANMPYIASKDMSILEVARFEPAVALDGGSDGLALIKRLLEQAPKRLAEPGLLLLEIGADQGEAVRALAQAAFPVRRVVILKDYANLDRIIRLE